MRRALVVDDSRASRLQAQRCLEALCFDVSQACDGLQGRAMLAEHHYDVLLLDWHMPGLTGIELLGELRTQAHTRELPVLMISSEVQQSNVALALERGATEYIMKPFTEQALREKLALLDVGISELPPTEI